MNSRTRLASCSFTHLSYYMYVITLQLCSFVDMERQILMPIAYNAILPFFFKSLIKHPTKNSYKFEIYLYWRSALD